jgi:1-acyl-sn-glycerol-3-phosphate acyltransferase
MIHQHKHYSFQLDNLSVNQALFIIFTVSVFLLLAVSRSPLVSIFLYTLPLVFILMSLPISLTFFRRKPVTNNSPLMLPPAKKLISL